LVYIISTTYYQAKTVAFLVIAMRYLNQESRTVEVGFKNLGF